MSEMDEAFSELQDAKAEVVTPGGQKPRREFVLLNGKSKAAIVSEIVSDQEFITGGQAQGGIFRASISQTILPNAPEKHTPIECRGQKLEVMSCNDVNGVTWDLVAGDPSSEER